MDTQPLMPASSGPFSTTPTGGGGRGPLLMVLLVVLGLGTITFGILTVTFSSKASSVQKSLNQQTAAAAAKASDEQKKTDDANYAKLNESPFRSYTAAEKYGSFVINFPKDWSSWVDEEEQGTQVNLVINPDFVKRTDGQDENMAVRVMLIIRSQDQYMAQYNAVLKSGVLKKSAIQVSGQPAFDLTGKFSGRKTIREVVVPIRDKVLIFDTEIPQYASEFNTILSQAKIVP